MHVRNDQISQILSDTYTDPDGAEWGAQQTCNISELRTSESDSDNSTLGGRQRPKIHQCGFLLILHSCIPVILVWAGIEWM